MNRLDHHCERAAGGGGESLSHAPVAGATTATTTTMRTTTTYCHYHRCLPPPLSPLKSILVTGSGPGGQNQRRQDGSERAKPPPLSSSSSSSSSSSPPSRTVRFDGKMRVKIVRPLDDYCDTALWYTRDEILGLSRETLRTIHEARRRRQRQAQGQAQGQGQQDECGRDDDHRCLGQDHGQARDRQGEHEHEHEHEHHVDTTGLENMIKARSISEWRQIRARVIASVLAEQESLNRLCRSNCIIEAWEVQSQEQAEGGRRIAGECQHVPNTNVRQQRLAEASRSARLRGVHHNSYRPSWSTQQQKQQQHHRRPLGAKGDEKKGRVPTGKMVNGDTKKKGPHATNDKHACRTIDNDKNDDRATATVSTTSMATTSTTSAMTTAESIQEFTRLSRGGDASTATTASSTDVVTKAHESSDVEKSRAVTGKGNMDIALDSNGIIGEDEYCYYYHDEDDCDVGSWIGSTIVVRRCSRLSSRSERNGMFLRTTTCTSSSTSTSTSTTRPIGTEKTVAKNYEFDETSSSLSSSSSSSSAATAAATAPATAAGGISLSSKRMKEEAGASSSSSLSLYDALRDTDDQFHSLSDQCHYRQHLRHYQHLRQDNRHHHDEHQNHWHHPFRVPHAKQELLPPLPDYSLPTSSLFDTNADIDRYDIEVDADAILNIFSSSRLLPRPMVTDLA